MAGNANSGRRPLPPKLDKTLTPLKLLRQTVQNEHAPQRERTASALGLLTHARVKKREKASKMSKAEAEYQAAMNAG